jgi:hypothetical protein
VVEDGEKSDALFISLIMMFKSAAMLQMGKVANPVTGKVERNLDQARFSIDIVEMLKEKTAGNISSDLAKLVDSTLLELRMNYVEEAGKKPESQTDQGDEAASEESPGEGDGSRGD